MVRGPGIQSIVARNGIARVWPRYVLEMSDGDECAVRRGRVRCGDRGKCGAGGQVAHDTPIEVQMIVGRVRISLYLFELTGTAHSMQSA
jgi:hypothetical protein